MGEESRAVGYHLLRTESVEGLIWEYQVPE